MSDQPEDEGKEIPAVEGETAAGGDEAVVPPPAIEPVDELPPLVEPPGDPPPMSEVTDESPPPAEEAKPVEEPPQPADNVEPPEAEPVEESPPPVNDSVEASGDAPESETATVQENVTTEPQQVVDGEVMQEEIVTDSASKPEGIAAADGAGEASMPGSRRESTQNEVQALTTAQILERLKKSYAQACKTLAVIGNIQRRESVLRLEEHQKELIKKFSKFEGHLEQLGLIADQSTQTSKHACECTSVPSEDLKPTTPQDNLPQVIICGREEQVPKIIVCEPPKKSNRKKNSAEVERERLLKTQKELVSKCEFMKEKLMFKETMIGNLHKQICSLLKENCVLRRQLAAKSNQTQQHCQCPGTTQNVCLASCPLHCRPNRAQADSPDKPANENSNVSQDVSKGSTSRDNPTDGNVEIETQEQPTPQRSGCSPESVCSPTCPNFKVNVPVADGRSSTKEGSKSTSLAPESLSENTLQQQVCPLKCPYFKANLPEVKEESKIPQPTDTSNENMSQHVCSTTCPYFNTHVPTVDECWKDSKIPPDGIDNTVEDVEVEIREQNLGNPKDIVPCNGDTEPNGEVCNPCPMAHMVLRLCDNKKPKQPTFCELKEEYTCLKKDFNNRMAELMTLRKDIVKHKEIAEQACVAQQRAEIEAKNMSEILKSIEDKHLMMLVPKERMMEMEQQIVVAKERFLESQDELEELRELTQRQSTQLGDYRSKYLQSHEQVEEQKGQIEMLELENSRISENVALEIQHVKNQFEVRLQALAPLPDILKATQEKVHDLQRQQEETERRYEDMEKELEAAKERVREYARQLDDSVTSSNMEIQGQGSMRKKLAKWEAKYNALKEENTELHKRVVEMDEVASNNRVRLTEKLHEVAQLTAALEMLRVESARQVARAKERLDTVRDALYAQVLELEQQVAESRAVTRTARKDRDNIRQRMQCQIDSLCESFEQAQVTILSLQEQVGFFNDEATGGRDKYCGVQGPREHTSDDAVSDRKSEREL